MQFEIRYKTIVWLVSLTISGVVSADDFKCDCIEPIEQRCTNACNILQSIFNPFNWPAVSTSRDLSPVTPMGAATRDAASEGLMGAQLPLKVEHKNESSKVRYDFFDRKAVSFALEKIGPIYLTCFDRKVTSQDLAEIQLKIGAKKILRSPRKTHENAVIYIPGICSSVLDPKDLEFIRASTSLIFSENPLLYHSGISDMTLIPQPSDITVEKKGSETEYRVKFEILLKNSDKFQSKKLQNFFKDFIMTIHAPK